MYAGNQLKIDQSNEHENKFIEDFNHTLYGLPSLNTESFTLNRYKSIRKKTFIHPFYTADRKHSEFRGVN